MDTKKELPPSTLDEVRESLRRTEEDCARLGLIIENLNLFIYDTDQDRSDMVPALRQFERLLKYCEPLRDKIRGVKEQMEQVEN